MKNFAHRGFSGKYPEDVYKRQGLDRYKGKKVLKMGVSDLIKKSDAVMKKIQDTFQ